MIAIQRFIDLCGNYCPRMVYMQSKKRKKLVKDSCLLDCSKILINKTFIGEEK